MTRPLGLVAVCLALAATGCASPTDDVVASLSPPTKSPSATTSPSAEPTGATKPAIVVRTPTPGDEVASPVTISGTADVFEATVSIRILGEDGGELAAAFATATCGSGCRGRYSAELFFFVERTQDGTVEVFESSADEGSPLHLVSVPVVLVAGG